MNSTLANYINKCVSLSDSELAVAGGFFEQRTLKKKQFLLQEGDICQFEAFIIRGCIKTYYIDNNGFETILTFATENWWVSDLVSFHEQKPSKMFIETLEETELLVLTPFSKEALLQRFPVLERMFRLMVQKHLASYQKRVFNNIALTAEQRYDIFLEKYPELPLRVPQRLIASYLGISPEFLSRLRKRKAKK